VGERSRIGCLKWIASRLSLFIFRKDLCSKGNTSDVLVTFPESLNELPFMVNGSVIWFCVSGPIKRTCVQFGWAPDRSASNHHKGSTTSIAASANSITSAVVRGCDRSAPSTKPTYWGCILMQRRSQRYRSSKATLFTQSPRRVRRGNSQRIAVMLRRVSGMHESIFDGPQKEDSRISEERSPQKRDCPALRNRSSHG
jgi:hypothetical protein